MKSSRNQHDGAVEPTTRGAPPSSGYSPVEVSGDGAAVVRLESDHPGFSDPSYRERRNAIAQLSVDHKVGDPIPTVTYTPQEDEVWQIVSSSLQQRHTHLACRAFVEAKEALELPTDKVPQLAEVSDRLRPLSGFTYQPVAGLAPLREFYGAFSSRMFFSTQYIRHPSVPNYTPEPDIVHEVIGHANQLANPGFAEIYLAVGDAVGRTRSTEALGFLSKVFWFTMEYGVVFEDGRPKAYGAGILSSVGEMDVFQGATIRPLDVREIGRAEYDITRYQPVIYSLQSMEQLQDTLLDFYLTYDDDVYATLTATPAH